MNTDSAIETPDDNTIVFHLKQPFAGFDYLAQLPQTDAGAAGQGHRRQVQGARRLLRPVQVRELLQPGKSFKLVRNTELGRGDRPDPQGAAGQVRRSRSTSTPTTSTTG